MAESYPHQATSSTGIPATSKLTGKSRSGKRKAAAAVAIAAALAIAASGTYAYSNMVNESLSYYVGATSNGARLHNDYQYDPNIATNLTTDGNFLYTGEDGATGDIENGIYVENYGEPDLIVRVRLYEYMDVAGNPTTPGTSPTDPLGTTAGNTKWAIWKGDNGIHGKNWTWTTGGNKYYMPTNNHADYDKDALPINTTVGDVTYLPEQLDSSYDITLLPKDDQGAYLGVYDTDDSDDDPAGAYTAADVGYDPTSQDAATLALPHNSYGAGVQQTKTATVSLMSTWSVGSTLGDTWVVDADGWAYYALPLAKNTATGLLLQKITQTTAYNNDYTYMIYGEMQAATIDDLCAAGKTLGTDDAFTKSGEAPSASAQSLINKIKASLDAARQ
jgi:hypothetical protein